MSRILITSALPYINGVKHLGNLAGSMLPADVYARFKRAQGCEVLCLCATDEHGTPAELAAAAAGQDVRTYCDEQHTLHLSAVYRSDTTFGPAHRWLLVQLQLLCAREVGKPFTQSADDAKPAPAKAAKKARPSDKRARR